MKTTITNLEQDERCTVFSKTPIKFAYFYMACAYRWEESADPIREDIEYFINIDEAMCYADNLTAEIGFSPIVEKIEVELDDIIEFVKSETGREDEDLLNEEFDLSIINYRNIRNYDSEEVYTLAEFSGNDIIGAVVIEWGYEKYVGYARNLKEIGIAGEWPFYDLKTESDLITGNEEATFKSNYSVLLTAKEVEDSEDLQADIEESLNSGNWKWNHFKNNPSSQLIQDRIKELA